MGRRYDIVQTPKGMRLEDIPKEIEVGVPFEINGELYVCEETGVSGLKVCTKNEDGCLKSSPSKHYYVIRKL